MYETLTDVSNIILDSDIENDIEHKFSTCIICLETGNELVQDINLLNNHIYKKLCICNAPVHKSCLVMWYTKSNKCLICHSKVLTINTPQQVIGQRNEFILQRNIRRNNIRKVRCNTLCLIVLVLIIGYIWINQINN